MSQTLYRCWIHLVWATYLRQPLLIKKIRNDVFNKIKEISEENGYILDTINGVEDHVHCLFILKPKHAISQMVNQIKGASSHWINTTKLTDDNFKWQSGFGVFTVSENDVPRVRAYIQNQEVHHQENNCKDDFEL